MITQTRETNVVRKKAVRKKAVKKARGPIKKATKKPGRRKACRRSTRESGMGAAKHEGESLARVERILSDQRLAMNRGKELFNRRVEVLTEAVQQLFGELDTRLEDLQDEIHRRKDQLEGRDQEGTGQ